MRKISYDPLMKTLIDRKMRKSELAEKATLSQSTINKINHDESVTLETISRICDALDCDISDIVEIRKS